MLTSLSFPTTRWSLKLIEPTSFISHTDPLPSSSPLLPGLSPHLFFRDPLQHPNWSCLRSCSPTQSSKGCHCDLPKGDSDVTILLQAHKWITTNFWIRCLPLVRYMKHFNISSFFSFCWSISPASSLLHQISTLFVATLKPFLYQATLSPFYVFIHTTLQPECEHLSGVNIQLSGSFHWLSQSVLDVSLFSLFTIIPFHNTYPIIFDYWWTYLSYLQDYKLPKGYHLSFCIPSQYKSSRLVHTKYSTQVLLNLIERWRVSTSPYFSLSE